MKNLALVPVLCILLFAGCSEKPVPTDNSTVKTQPSQSPVTASSAGVSDYFPFTKDVHMKYKGTGNEYAEFETYVDYVKDGTMQVRSLNGGTVMAFVYQIKDGALKKVFAREETYFRYDFTLLRNQDEIIIKEPIKEGTAWTLKDGSTRSITAVDRQIKTPAGDFKALEVTTKGSEHTTINYYVKDIGLVKSEFKSGIDSFAVTSELEKVENGVPYKHSVRFYYPDFSNNRVAYMDRDIDIFTNQDMKFKFQKELKTISENSGLTKVLSPNTQVMGSVMDDEQGVVTVDFSAHLVNEMNAGTSLEGLLLKSITNTFGDYYQKDKVVITLEGKLYESGHFFLKQGEHFKVDRNNAAEYIQR